MKINDSLIIAYHKWLISLLTPISQIILSKDIIIQSQYENSFMFKRNKKSKQICSNYIYPSAQIFFKRLYNNLIVYIHEEYHCQFTVSSLVNCNICKIEKKLFFLNLHKPHTIKKSLAWLSFLTIAIEIWSILHLLLLKKIEHP